MCACLSERERARESAKERKKEGWKEGERECVVSVRAGARERRGGGDEGWSVGGKESAKESAQARERQEGGEDCNDELTSSRIRNGVCA